MATGTSAEMMTVIDDAGAREAPSLDAAPNDTGAESILRETAGGAIAVDFPSFSDGRGFSLGRRLRALGFAGRLRAQGRLIPDQYAYARSCGFDEVAVPAALYQRQGADAWAQSGAHAAPPFARRRAG